MFRRPTEELTEARRNVPTIKCYTIREADILANMWYAACAWIGGLENTLQDYPEDDEEYLNAKQTLADHQSLVDDIRSMCMSGYYGCGLEAPQQKYQKNYNLAGNEFINSCAEAVVKAMGY